MPTQKTTHKTCNDAIFKSALLKILYDLDIDHPNHEVSSKNKHIKQQELIRIKKHKNRG